MQVLIGVSIAFAALAVVFLALAARTLRRRRWAGTAGRSTLCALFASLSTLAATLSVSTQGYRALTSEELALTVTTVPTGPRSFQAYVEYADGRDTTLAVMGDQILVEARILKWRYLANVIGFQTQYEMDRLTGRYSDIEEERTLERTVHALGFNKPVDLYDLVERYTPLRFLVDTEYGSGTYIDVNGPTRFEVRVSTTGLLIREVPLG